MYNHLLDFIDQNDIIYEHQYGFRQKHSTQQAIITLVIIYQKLNWCEHIAYVKNKVSKGVGILYRARQFLDKKCLYNLYYSYVYPYLIYCIEVWGSACQTHLHPLFLAQIKFKIAYVILCIQYRMVCFQKKLMYYM